MKKIIFLFLFLAHSLFAVNDTLNNPRKPFVLRYYTIDQFEYSDSITVVDNSLLGFQNYLPLNTLGNTGLPYDRTTLKNEQAVGFKYGRNPMQEYCFTPYALKFYNTRIPFSDLFVVFGSKSELLFKMTLAYNVKKNWNFTANFSRIKSTGFYTLHKTDETFFALSTNYKSNNNRYWLLASGIVNDTRNEESGGMTNDSILAKKEIINGGMVRTAFSSLNAAKNYKFNKNIFFRQYLNLGYRKNDSAAIVPTSRFILTSSFDDMSQKYLDNLPLSKYYSAVYYDSVKTHDSSYVLKLENELAWKRVDNLKHRGFMDMIGGGVSVKNQYIQVKQREIDTALINFIGAAQLNNLYSKRNIFLQVSATYGLNGYSKDDYTLRASASKSWADSLAALVIWAKTGAQAPDYSYTRFSSNHYKWVNNFEKVKATTIAGSLSIKKYDFAIQADLTSYTNVLYLDPYAQARQYLGTIPVFSIQLQKNIRFFNWHLANNITYQKAPDSTVIRVPELIFQHALYFEKDVFKKAMHVQIGLSVYYNTAYYANAYNPALSQFYLQNDKKYGNYPVVNFFFNAKVKVVTFFFKIDHLNYGMTGNNFMLTPDYLLSTRAFKLGVSWKFWD